MMVKQPAHAPSDTAGGNVQQILPPSTPVTPTGSNQQVAAVPAPPPATRADPIPKKPIFDPRLAPIFAAALAEMEGRLRAAQDELRNTLQEALAEHRAAAEASTGSVQDTH